MQSSYPKVLSRYLPNLLYALVMPAFFLLFVLLYEPTRLCSLLRIGEAFHPEGNAFSFNTAIVTSIILVALMLSRILYFLLRKAVSHTLGIYGLWCLLEIVVSSGFVALYLTLRGHGETEYFPLLGMCTSALISILVYPYAILTLYYMFKQAQQLPLPDEGTRLKFYDSRHQLKFITTVASVLYIEAAENYIILHYSENGVEKKYQIRNSMKNIEPLCASAGFVRTHRSFIVNPSHVKLIRRDPGGFYFADLGTSREEGIPVSKKYYDSLAAVL